MSAEQNEAIIDRIIQEAFNRGNLEVVDETLAEDFVEHNPFPGDHAGPGGIQAVDRHGPERLLGLRGNRRGSPRATKPWNAGAPGARTRRIPGYASNRQRNIGHEDRDQPLLRRKARRALGRVRRPGHDAAARRDPTPEQPGAGTA